MVHSLLVCPATLIGYWRLLEDTPRRSERRRQPPLQIVGPTQVAVRVEPLTDEQMNHLRASDPAETSRWPDPRSFVDATWASSERRLVVDFLERCTRVNQSRGLSACRFCGKMNGSAEITDWVYCWPEGLAHYVDVHEVRLPDAFVSHVRSAQNPLHVAPRPSFDELGQRNRSWPGAEFAHLLWSPSEALESDGLPCVAPDATWWLQQTGIF